MKNYFLTFREIFYLDDKRPVHFFLALQKICLAVVLFYRHDLFANSLFYKPMTFINETSWGIVFLVLGLSSIYSLLSERRKLEKQVVFLSIPVLLYWQIAAYLSMKITPIDAFMTIFTIEAIWIYFRLKLKENEQ